MVNILPKFNENLMKGSEDMEQTRDARLKLVTLNCDLDLRYGTDTKCKAQTRDIEL